jgi:hypothetical protein
VEGNLCAGGLVGKVSWAEGYLCAHKSGLEASARGPCFFVGTQKSVKGTQHP